MTTHELAKLLLESDDVEVEIGDDPEVYFVELAGFKYEGKLTQWVSGPFIPEPKDQASL